MKNKLIDILFWVGMVVIGFYLLYTKGLILNDYQSVEPKVAYTMIENDDNLTIVDVRTPDEYKQDGHIARAKLVPLLHLESNLNMIDKSKKVLVYCRSGNRSATASRLLSKNGFTVINMSGGMIGWKSAKLPIE